MAISLPISFWRSWLLSRRSPANAGFTMVELLVSTFIGFMALTGLLFLVNEILQVDRRDVGRVETQRDMADAVDFIKEELREAIYVYSGGCLGTAVNNTICPTRTTTINAEVGLPAAAGTPVLAFWKFESLPYVENPTTAQNLPPNCTSFTGDLEKECKSVLLSRNAPTLVIYTLDQNDPVTEDWQGQARIRRYALRKYDQDQLSTIVDNYDGNPSTPSFQTWTCRNDGGACAINQQGDALVDFVDFAPSTAANSISATQFCNNLDDTLNGVDYDLSPQNADTTSTSFFACVKQPPSTDASADFLQDVVIYLRGNAARRSGLAATSRAPAYLPNIQTIVQVRSAVRRRPPEV